MKQIKLTIHVEPVGKARPRASKKGFFYTPPKTAHAEALIREAVLKQSIYFGKGIPLYLEATFYRARPKSLSKKVGLPVTRPDWDNEGKLLTDSLEKFVYANDSQITTAVIKKRFALLNTTPRIDLLIREDK